MATYFVANGGSNTSPYETWAKAATSLQTALTAATTAGDVVVIQYDAVPSGDTELSADTTFTNSTNVSIVSASNDGGSAYTLTAMGTSNWIGNSTTNRAVRFGSADTKLTLYGLTIRVSGSTVDLIGLGNGPGCSLTAINCYFWQGQTTASGIYFGSSDAFVRVYDSTIRFGHEGSMIGSTGGASAELINCSISSDGTAPTALLPYNSYGVGIKFIGCDLSFVTGTLCSDAARYASAIFDRCKLGSGVTVLASQTSNPTTASCHALVLDSNSGDSHGLMEYHNYAGSVVIDTGIYFTAGAAGKSWKIVTSAGATRKDPFVTPWIDLYWDGTSAIAPYIEILRDGSATAFTDAEIWIEVAAKTTSGSTKASFSNDRQAIAAFIKEDAGSAQADGAGTGSWTGEGGTAKSMKLGLGSNITPAEAGSLTARIFVAAASATVYVDPQIRT